MNLLAHAFLSFEQPGILEGNMISDFVKGRKQYDYKPLIQKGIKLHRLIDTFTDEHYCTKEMQKFFKPVYRLYAGAFCDIVYDYFLANDRTQFLSDAALKNFTLQTYQVLEKELQALPLPFRQMFPYMHEQDWLYNYQFDWGIKKSFHGMASRAKYISESDSAYVIFKNKLPEMKLIYDEFFPLLKNYSSAALTNLLNTV